MRPATDKQLALLDHLQRHIDANGQAPTQAEIARHLDVNRAAVRNRLVALRRKGLITMPKGVHRGIAVAPPKETPP